MSRIKKPYKDRDYLYTVDGIRSLLDELDMSQRKAARVLDIDQRMMRKFCDGSTKPAKCVVMALLHLLECNDEDFAAYIDPSA